MASDYLLIGKIVNTHGLEGFVKILSYSVPKEGIFKYRSWLLADLQATLPKVSSKSANDQMDIYEPESWSSSKKLLVKFGGIVNIDQAQALVGKHIFIHNNQLPSLNSNEFYWKDLLDCQVYNLERQKLGGVVGLIECGDKDALEVQGARFYIIPFVVDVYIFSVDVKNKIIKVDWSIDDFAK